jgi:membrane protease YdiL (CAAX protease family)
LTTTASVLAGSVRGLKTGELLLAAPGIFLLLAGYFGLASSGVRSTLAAWIRHSPFRAALLLQALALPYLAYCVPLRCFSAAGLLALLFYLNLPLWILTFRTRGSHSPVTDFLALLLIWLPVELRWMPPLWSWPPEQNGRFLYGILGVILGLYLFDVVRALPDIGFTLVPRKRDWIVAGWALLLFVPVALILGGLSGFVGVGFHLPLPPAWNVLGRLLGIFLVTAVPEELLFRGLLQNLVRHWTGRPILALAVSASLFGLAHLNVGSRPDWRLALLATLAGLAYGGAYQASGRLIAAMLAHTFVNGLWLLLLKG